MTNKQSNVPAKKTEAEVPAFLTQDGALGTEDFTQEDSVIPRLKIVQGLSKAKQVNPDLRDGELYNSMTAESLGKQVEVYFLFKSNSTVWFDKQRNFLGTEFIDAQTKEVKRFGNVNWADKEEYDRGLRCFNYMVVTVNEIRNAYKNKVQPEILIYSAMSAALKPARNLNGQLKQNGRKNIPIFGQRVMIGTSIEKFDEGDAYMPTFTFTKYVTEEEYALLKACYDVCHKVQGTQAAHEDKGLNAENGGDPSMFENG